MSLEVLVQQEVNQDGAAESENEKKQESSSFPNKHPPQNQQVDSMHTVTSRSTAPINSKKSGSRGEVGFTVFEYIVSLVEIKVVEFETTTVTTDNIFQLLQRVLGAGALNQ